VASVLATLPLSFERPEWLWLLLIVPAVMGVTLYARSLNSLPVVRRWMALTVRALLLTAIVLAMAGAEHVRESRNLAVVFLVDQSRSIPESLRLRQEAFIRDIQRMSHRPYEDKAAVITFDGKSTIEQLPMLGVFIERFSPPTEPDRTDLAQGIRLAMATFPEGMAKRIVLLSDGNQNAGDAVSEAVVAASNGISVDVVPMEYEHENEVMFDRLVVPSQANVQDRLPIRMLLRSRRAAGGTVVLYHNEERVLATHETLKPGINPLVCELQLNTPGVHRLEARFEPDRPEMDSVAQNNVARAFTLVQGEGTVLLVTTDPACDEPMNAALKRERVQVDMVSMERSPEDILGFLEHEAIILSNIAADRFTEDQKKMLATYVRDMGGGLVMTGGNEGFGAGGWLGSAVEDVMPLRFDVKQRKQIMKGALVTIMHTCEAPQGNFLAEEVAIAALKTISTLDYFGLIAFGYQGGTNWEIPLQVALAKERMIDQIRKISGRIGDMPDFGTAMEMAYQALLKTVDAAQKHIIIISDGDAAAPSESLLRKLKEARITVSTVAIGFGAHVMEPTMKWVAGTTGGRYYKADDPKKLPQIFVKEAKVVRRPLIREVQEGFRPRLRTLMPEITAGLSDGELPPLTGYVLTTPRSMAQEFSTVLITSDKEDPLMAVRQCELGRSVAFTGGWWSHWGREWAAWEKFGKLWAQTLRWVMRQRPEADFEVSTRLVGQDGQIIIEAVDKDATFLNGLTVAGTVLMPDLKGHPIRLDQTGPGRYEGRFPASADGHYVAMLNYTTPKGKKGQIRTGLSVSYSAEYRELSTNDALLAQVAQRTGGKVLEFDAAKADVFRRPVRPSVQRRPIWPWIVGWFVLPLLLMDVTVRRLASIVAISIGIEILIVVWLLGAAGLWRIWWAWPVVVLVAEGIGWAVRWRSIPRVIELISSELRGLRSAEAAPESVLRLKGVRERIREEMAERAESQAAAVDAAPIDTKARFDVGERKAQPVGELDHALGGAKSVEPSRPAKGVTDQDRKGHEDELTTSRLLEAKRRARRTRQGDE